MSDGKTAFGCVDGAMKYYQCTSVCTSSGSITAANCYPTFETKTKVLNATTCVKLGQNEANVPISSVYSCSGLVTPPTPTRNLTYSGYSPSATCAAPVVVAETNKAKELCLGTRFTQCEGRGLASYKCPQCANRQFSTCFDMTGM